ncbi:carboxymuconolactone decarboxylase family protein [Roseivirga sp. BDSF3-8]|uniref:carboxymuconolactone decarboxylase family protein n=1 Tax=Roseivirga sp. BDSF3-8 TaxID=3241598 RepID=UPI003531AFFE
MEATLEITEDYKQDLALENDQPLLEIMELAGSKQIKDLRVNLRNNLETGTLSRKEGLLIALAIAINERHPALTNSFSRLAREEGATEAEVAEMHACASLLATNNVVYRFKHFMDSDTYQNQPVKIKMGIMMKPVTGKEFFELVSTAISAVNGCEMCVRAHEASLLKLDCTPERIFDAVRLAGIVTGLTKSIN